MSIEQTYDPDIPATLGGQGTAGDYFALLKPRVMSLVIFTAIVGLVAAPGHIHPWMGFITILSIAIGAGAAGALNMWYDADIDALMKRTGKRPIPSGAVQPGEALGFGMALMLISVIMLGLDINLASAALLAFTIFFYVVIYTMGLKRRTAQNIVIGGAAGAFPPVVAWVAVTGHVDLGAVALFILIFVWTPPHFWALALFREGDYAKAGIPMLPNVAGRTETKKQILMYTLACIPAAALAYFTGVGGVLYAAGALLLTAGFLASAISLYRAAEGVASDMAAKRLFGFSITWLFGMFALILAEKLISITGFAGGAF